jgi:hypothetical protein
MLLLILLAGITPRLCASDSPSHVYVVLWFDTEDYLLPASDDAALHLARFLTGENIRATFKVVGEKARTLERRGRTDVIEALKKHEIGYHSNYHSVQPTPASYLSNLGWDEGVTEFDRRERPGYEDVKRIFNRTPTCYGQPGSSWGPQVYGAMRNWGMHIYLDAGSHVQLNGRPCYFAGAFTLYNLAHMTRAGLGGAGDLEAAERHFRAAHDSLIREGGGVVSIMYHPCEFVHKQFWDGVNFRNGANPPRSRWQVPPAKTPDETRAAFQIFEDYIRFIERFSEARFVTASEAADLYRDRARGRKFTAGELKTIARGVGDYVGFQEHGDYALAASEIFVLLNKYVAERVAGHTPDSITLEDTPIGPTGMPIGFSEGVTADRSQFERTVLDVADFVKRQGRIPSAVWLGSLAVPPESYLRALAQFTTRLADGEPIADPIRLRPATLAPAVHVADDNPAIWRWVIFPPGFHAPALMQLAKRQAWSLKPAILQKDKDPSIHIPEKQSSRVRPRDYRLNLACLKDRVAASR